MPYSRHMLLSILLFYCSFSNGQGIVTDKTYVDLCMKKTDSLLAAPNNGYSTSTIKKLQAGIDALNNSFESYCKDKKYYSRQQGHAHYVHLYGAIATTTLADIKNNISFNDFRKKYPGVTIVKDLLIVKLKYGDNSSFAAISFDSGHPKGYYQIDHVIIKGNWIVSSDGHDAFYLPEGIESKPLPEKYARMAAYIDHMADTCYWPFLPGAAESWLYQESDTNKPINTFLDYVNRNTGKPDITYSVSAEIYKRWFNNRYKILDSLVAGTAEFMRLFADAKAAALKRGYATAEMEDYIERYSSKENALLLKRGRKVQVDCGNDYRPHYRIHSMQRLAAETGDVRLYMLCSFYLHDALGGVNTRKKSYVSQLEELHISPVGIILGYYLYVEPPTETSMYFPRGSSYRLADHIATSGNADYYITELLAAISDPQLDNYNRVLLCQPYIQYISHLKGHDDYVKHTNLLQKAMATLPEYYSRQIKIPEEARFIR